MANFFTCRYGNLPSYHWTVDSPVPNGWGKVVTRKNWWRSRRE